MSKDIPFDSIVVGETLGPIEYPVKTGHVKQYTEDWKDPNPIYLEDSSFGGPIVPPAYRAGLDSFSLLGSKYNARATVGVSTEHKFIAPLKPDQTVSAKGVLTDKYIKRGIEYVVIVYELLDESGTLIRQSVDCIALSVERVDQPDTPGH